jgi:hypothetical protein
VTKAPGVKILWGTRLFQSPVPNHLRVVLGEEALTLISAAQSIRAAYLRLQGNHPPVESASEMTKWVEGGSGDRAVCSLRGKRFDLSWRSKRAASFFS